MQLFPIALVMLLAWGALAVGGSPSWAGVPVALFAITTGILGCLESKARSAGKLAHRPVLLALFLFLAGVSAQLVPLPATIVARMSPSQRVADFERVLAIADRRDPELVEVRPAGAPSPLSIAPPRTWWGFGFIAAFAIFLWGTAQGLSTSRAPQVAKAIVVLGVIVAFLGMYQTTTESHELYGFYAPLSPVHRSAPFINRNHQAGWLVMAMALALGAFVGEVARGMSDVRPGWRNRLVWFTRPDANLAVLLLFASFVMAIGILTVRSRSGAAMLLFTVMTLAVWSIRRQPLKATRRFTAIGMIAIATIALATSAPAVMSRFDATSWATMDGRIAIWQNSLRILGDFWLTGTGFNTYGVAMLHYQTVSDGYRYIETHNDYLQLAIEGGLFLSIPAGVLIASLVREIRLRFNEGADDTRTYWVRAGAVTGIMGIAIQSFGEFTLQMPGAAVMFATLMAIATHHPYRRYKNPIRRELQECGAEIRV